MQAYSQDENIDKLVDYRAEYSAAIKNPRISGDELTGCCPFHDDRKNSFSADLKTGKWTCFAEGINGNYTTFYAKLNNLSNKDAYIEIKKRYGAYKEHAEKPKGLQNYTLGQYAFEKRFPLEWLESFCGMETRVQRGDGTKYLYVPYMNATGGVATYRKRFGGKEFRWKMGAGQNIIPYGLWQIDRIREAGYVVLVEGESDSHSMWQMGISALGIPGASMMRKEWADILQDLKVYIHVEPDKGGETFLVKVTRALKEGNFIGSCFKFSCGVLGKKDPSDVYLAESDPGQARVKILKLITSAEPVDISEDPIPDNIQDAPVKLRTPEDWIISDSGIKKMTDKKGLVRICRTPILITQRLSSIETREEKIEIAFKRDDTWQRAIFPRSIIFTSRAVTALADLGCTVTSENARDIVSYLSALEAENIDIIKKADSTSSFGWQEGKEARFLPGYDKDIVLDIDPSQRSMAAAYTQNGTFREWIDLVAPFRSGDKFRFILAAAFTAPILKIIKQRIFIVYNWGGSRGGKTAALKAALSAWGDPERLMMSFNATQVGLERMAAFYNDLPLGIDERQLAGNNQGGIERMVYMISSGVSKVRGAKSGGLQSTKTWRTVAIATGEEPITTDSSQTGVSTRVLEIYGGPFTEERDASFMHQQTSIHHGWAGQAFIGRVLSVSEDDIVRKYEEMSAYVHELSDGKSGSHIAGIAAVALADALADTWIFKDPDIVNYAGYKGSPISETLNIDPGSWERAKEMAKYILDAQMDAEASDVNEMALQYVIDWILSNDERFPRDGTTYKGTGAQYGYKKAGRVYVYPSIFNSALSDAGYSPRKTLKYLADKNLIGVSEENGAKRNSVRVTRDYKTIRFVEIFMDDIFRRPDGTQNANLNANHCDLSKDDDGSKAKLQNYQMEIGDIAEMSGFKPLPEDEELPF